MAKISKQVTTGKAFEYALLHSLYERLQHHGIQVDIVASAPYVTARSCFLSIGSKDQSADRLAASFAVNLLLDLEPKLTHALNEQDTLQLEIVADVAGEDGDVRDVLAIRSSQEWEIGISAKHHHRAVKHPRLSASIDFGAKWLGIPCSSEFMARMKEIFLPLKERRRQSKATAKWEELGDYTEGLYVPVLEAFKQEIYYIDKAHPHTVAAQLVQYLIGRMDFYKVIKLDDRVEVQAYNLHGTLNQASMQSKPKAKIPRLKLPTRILDISYAAGSKTTLIFTMDEGWQMSFRIHVASSRIESSLKFDVNLVSSPHTLFINQLILPKP